MNQAADPSMAICRTGKKTRIGMSADEFDLMTTVDYGGCSAKLDPSELSRVLQGLFPASNPNVLVDISTHDDAGVYRIDEERALIQTVDFFPPICSDPYTYGQIAAANALSDVFAMGGQVLTALNLVMFPSGKIPMDVLREILRGGIDKVEESGGVIVGGHTIDDSPPKYGLAVTGMVHPQKIITNAAALPGDCLILTKPLGVGVISAARRIGMADEEGYRQAIETMKQLNRQAVCIMQEFRIRAATDITGFGLLGHALKMAMASRTTFRIKSLNVPVLPSAYPLAEAGCLPGAAFRNLRFIEKETLFRASLDYSLKMLLCDAQTSGGLLMAVRESDAESLVSCLRHAGYPEVQAIGEVLPKTGNPLEIH
jgi:selenide, water dikinase